MEIYDIVKKLTGHVYPAGKSEIDEQGLKNLKILIKLTSQLLYDIDFVARHHNRAEYSMKIMGEEALNFLKALPDSLESIKK